MRIKNLLFIFLLFLVSCNESNNNLNDNNNDSLISEYNCACDEDYYKYKDEYEKMENNLQLLYNDSNKNYRITLKKADSLLNLLSTDNDTDKYIFFYSFIENLKFLKAELYYLNGEFNKSINELKNNPYNEFEIALACNYVKLKKYEIAKQILDTMPISYYSDYLFGNYYEVIGKKNDALSLYNRSIEDNKSSKNCLYYKLAVKRVEELGKQNPILLDEIYFVTGNPNFETCEDICSRGKIYSLVSNIDIVRNDPECKFRWIYQDPSESDDNFWWIKVGTGMIDRDFKTKYNFFVNNKTLEIMIYDSISKKRISINE